MKRLAGLVIVVGALAASAGSAADAQAASPATSVELAATVPGGPFGPAQARGPAVSSVGSFAPNLPRQGGAFDALDRCVEAEMRQQGTPGVSLAVAIEGRRAYTQTYGVKHATLGGEIGPDTYFRINSTTKSMTGAAIALARERGALDVDAPITELMPELALRAPWQASALTAHDLMSSQAGVPGGYADLGTVPVTARPGPEVSLQAWTDSLRHMHLFAPPRSFFNYSSAGISLAAAALERATGVGYADFVERELWRPAGMHRTTMDPAVVEADGDYAMGHMWGQVFGPSAWAEAYSAPSGGAYATPGELLTWAGMLAEGGRGVLAPESVDWMTTAHAAVANVPITTDAGYGYGVFVEDFRERESGRTRRVVYHPGNGRGYATELFWVPETGFAVAILSNTPTGMNQSALCALRELADLVRLPVDRTPPDAATLDRYAGSYGLVDGMGNAYTARVWREGDGLRIEYPDWNTLPTIGGLVGQREMSFRHGEVFRYDGYGTLDARFVSADPGDAHARWMEHLFVVGARAGTLPAEVALEGGSCAEVALTPDRDGSVERLGAHGLNPVLTKQDVPIRQDDPERPESARVRIDLPAAGEVAFLMAYHWAEADDDLDLYLLRDANGDGAFVYPEERVDELTGGGLGFLGRTPLPPGDYQLWVHGRQVRGADSRFAYDLVMVAGEDLWLEDLPEALEGGAEQRVTLCAKPLAGEEPRLGMLTLGLEDGLRVARVPVRVAPGGTAPPAIYLPALSAAR